MPRTSKKTSILAQAMDIVAADGIDAVTYDRLATETGLSKSGLLYHFPSRHELLIALHEYGSAQWELKVIEQAGGLQAHELDQHARAAAIVSAMAEHETLAELLVTLHSRTHPDFLRPWMDMEDRWLPRADDAATSPALLAATVLASGLWVHDRIYGRELAAPNRQRLLDKALELIAQDAKDSQVSPETQA